MPCLLYIQTRIGEPSRRWYIVLGELRRTWICCTGIFYSAITFLAINCYERIFIAISYLWTKFTTKYHCPSCALFLTGAHSAIPLPVPAKPIHGGREHSHRPPVDILCVSCSFIVIRKDDTTRDAATLCELVKEFGDLPVGRSKSPRTEGQEDDVVAGPGRE